MSKPKKPKKIFVDLSGDDLITTVICTLMEKLADRGLLLQNDKYLEMVAKVVQEAHNEIRDNLINKAKKQNEIMH